MGLNDHAACCQCRHKKIRCSRERPQCLNCARLGYRCEWSEKGKKPNQTNKLSNEITDLRNRVETLETLVATMHGSLHVPLIPAKPLAIFDSDSNYGPSDCEKMELNGYGHDILGQGHTRLDFETPLKRRGTEPRSSSDLYSGKLGLTQFNPVEQQQYDIYTQSHEVSCLPPEPVHVQPVLTETNQCPLLAPGEQANYYTGPFQRSWYETA